MAQGPKLTEGGRALLFDRLVDLEGPEREEWRPLRVLQRNEVRESVCRELEKLFNTRCPVSRIRLRERERTVIDYGLPDFSSQSASSGEDQTRLADEIREAISVYEPRLCEVSVSIEVDTRKENRLLVKIAAVLVTESVREAVSFPLLKSEDQWSIDVDDGE